tara:strand:+ start:401 stop:637 length:237 start_codon:yes stop_codon:yes gene_type:complete
MNEESTNPNLDILQGRGDFQSSPVFFPQLGDMNRGMLHRPTIAGIRQAGLIASDMQNRSNGERNSVWNDPSVIQDYLN